MGSELWDMAVRRAYSSLTYESIEQASSASSWTATCAASRSPLSADAALTKRVLGGVDPTPATAPGIFQALRLQCIAGKPRGRIGRAFVIVRECSDPASLNENRYCQQQGPATYSIARYVRQRRHEDGVTATL